MSQNRKMSMKIGNLNSLQNQSMGFVYNDITREILKKLVDPRDVAQCRRLNSLFCVMLNPTCVMLELVKKVPKLIASQYVDPSGSAIARSFGPVFGWKKLEIDEDQEHQMSSPIILRQPERQFSIRTYLDYSVLDINQLSFFLLPEIVDLLKNVEHYLVKLVSGFVVMFVKDCMFFCSEIQ
jgi:hypothetical protein